MLQALQHKSFTRKICCSFLGKDAFIEPTIEFRLNIKYIIRDTYVVLIKIMKQGKQMKSGSVQVHCLANSLNVLFKGDVPSPKNKHHAIQCMVFIVSKFEILY